jgi:hypothetical protein
LPQFWPAPASQPMLNKTWCSETLECNSYCTCEDQ